jgi:hypothetical protein
MRAGVASQTTQRQLEVAPMNGLETVVGNMRGLLHPRPQAETRVPQAEVRTKAGDESGEEGSKGKALLWSHRSKTWKGRALGRRRARSWPLGAGLVSGLVPIRPVCRSECTFSTGSLFSLGGAGREDSGEATRHDCPWRCLHRDLQCITVATLPFNFDHASKGSYK